VIATCFCEEGSVADFYRRTTNALAPLGVQCEFIFVDDGSTDATLSILREVAAADPRVRVIALRENAGQWPAMTAGYLHATGRGLLFMDVDLEIPPEELPSFVAAFRAGAEIVSAHRLNRSDSVQRIIVSRLGNVAVRYLLGIRLSDAGSGLKIIDRRLLDHLSLTPQDSLNPFDVFTQAADVVNLPVRFTGRQSGQSHWAPGRVVQQFLIAFREHLRRRRGRTLRRLRGGLLAGAGVAALAGAGLGAATRQVGEQPVLWILVFACAVIACAAFCAFRFMGRVSAAKGFHIAEIIGEPSSATASPSDTMAADARNPPVNQQGAVDLELDHGPIS